MTAWTRPTWTLDRIAAHFGCSAAELLEHTADQAVCRATGAWDANDAQGFAAWWSLYAHITAAKVVRAVARTRTPTHVVPEGVSFDDVNAAIERGLVGVTERGDVAYLYATPTGRAFAGLPAAV